MQVLYGISQYSRVYGSTRENTVHIAGFRGAHRDAALRESVLPPEVLPPVDSGEADPLPVAEDDEFFHAPDAQSKEEAINKFLDGIEGQECSGFKDIHRFLNHLPVPAGTETRSMPHADARDGNFLPSMTEDEQKRFTPSELLLYKHALEYR